MTLFGIYQKTQYHLTLDEADEIASSIVSQLDFTRDDDRSLYANALEAAVVYTGIRARWSLMETDEKRATDEARSAAHNSFITNLNILSRYMKKQGMNVAWREKLGDPEKDPGYRKRIGDFACWWVMLVGCDER